MLRALPLLALFALALLIAACDDDQVPAEVAYDDPIEGAVRTGADRLAEAGHPVLDGRRLGLIVNHTAVVGDDHLIDALAARDGMEIAALFGPEHGLRGEADAGEKVDDGVDDRTGAPVYSLYGQTRKPTPEMLDGVEALVFDIQDVGARFYTYISTMGLAMQAAAEAGIPFVVLDRPNPLSGNYVSGFVLSPGLESFVGQYPIPIAHGLTVGELAGMIKGEALLPGLAELDLHVIEMDGWDRELLWDETGLDWIAPSPNIPDFETALVYAGTCLFEATPTVSEGRGTETPFKLLGAPWADGPLLADVLNARALPGVVFEAADFTPRSIDGMSSNPKLRDEPLQGIRIRVTEPETYRPVETGIHVLEAFHAQAPEGEAFFNGDWLARLAGTDGLDDALEGGQSAPEIIASWQEATTDFVTRRASYLLY